ncbi:MAG: hypothetical protein ACJ74Q_03645 [Pyrinomonadaceae bacterium]
MSLSLAGACAGQNSGKSKSGSRKAKPRPEQEPEEISVEAPVSEPSEEKEVGEATARYFGPPADSSLAQLYLSEVYKGRGQTIDLDLYFEQHGKGLVRPDKVLVTFVSNGASFKANRLELEADGQKLGFDIMSSTARFAPLPFTEIDVESFEQLANAKSVKGRLGRLAFELDDSQREALRDLLRTVEVMPRKP